MSSINHGIGRSSMSMAASESLEANWGLRAVALLEIAGGLFGTGMAAALFLNTQHPLSIVAGVMYLTSLAAGALLWKDISAGYWMSLGLAVVQIPWILTSKLAYVFASGAALMIGAGNGDPTASYSITSQFHFGYAIGWGPSNFSAEPWTLGINVVAVAMVAFLLTQMKLYRNRKTHSRR